MKFARVSVMFAAIALAALLFVGFGCESGPSAEPPVAQIIPKVDTLHGDVRVDNYFWLRDKSDSNVIAYLEAENAYTEAMTAHTKDFQEKIFQELIGRIKETDLDVPYKLGSYYYYSRTEEGKEYKIYCRKLGDLDGVEEIILDVNEIAAGKDYCYLAIFEVSPDQNLLAYGIDTTGAEQHVLYFKNLTTGKILSDTLSGLGYSFEWANDNRTCFYTTRGEANRPDRVWRHQLGSKQTDDKLIFLEEDERMYVGLEKTKDQQFILVQIGSHTTYEYHYLYADDPLGKFWVIAPRVEDVEYYVWHHDDKFYILTNENATNFKLVTAPDANPGKENWTDLISHRKDVTLSSLEMFKDFMAVIERQNGLPQIQIRNFETGENHYVEWPEPAYSFDVHSNYEFTLDKIRFTYQSMTTPRTVYDYDMKTRQRDLLKEYEVLGGFDKSDYRAERIFVTARDGVKVPVSIVYRPDKKKASGGNPCYVYVYGSYGDSMDPYFSSNRLTLLDRGFVFCLAHVRGGGEMGRGWYDDGRMEHKMNTFTDLIDCCEGLIAQGYTTSKQLIISGGSAGGLTVGAAMNMKPDLFEMVIADVPFVDVINTMLDASIPLTALEYEEWGNPKVESEYRYMLKYSPYDNVVAKDYPTILILTSLNDPRVAFWEPAKWAAKLRALKTDKNLLLLKTNMGAGHGGSSGRYERYHEMAFEYAFILDHFGIEK
ncbi:MAG: S9 family peptidase [bacterium]